jgi:hypothetical protein
MNDIGVFATTRTGLVMSLTPSETHVDCVPGADLSIRGCLRVKEKRKCPFSAYLHLCLSSAIVGAAKRQGANLDQHGRVGPRDLQVTEHVWVHGVLGNKPRLPQRPTGNTDLHLSVCGRHQTCHDGGLEVIWSDKVTPSVPYWATGFTSD